MTAQNSEDAPGCLGKERYEFFGPVVPGCQLYPHPKRHLRHHTGGSPVADVLEAIAGCNPVVFHHKGFRLLCGGHDSPTASRVETIDNAAGLLFRWLSSAPFQTLVSLIPIAVLHWARRPSNDLTFDSFSRDGEPLMVRGGHFLLLLEQS